MGLDECITTHIIIVSRTLVFVALKILCVLPIYHLLPTPDYNFRQPRQPNISLFTKRFISLFFRERGAGGEIEEEKERCVKHRPMASCLRLNQGPNPQPSVCSDREPNLRPFTLRPGAQPAEPHGSGLSLSVTPRLHEENAFGLMEWISALYV